VVDPKKRATAEQLLKHPWIVAQSKGGAFFAKEEIETINKAKTTGPNSRSNSIGSLLELFSNEGVSRS